MISERNLLQPVSGFTFCLRKNYITLNIKNQVIPRLSAGLRLLMIVTVSLVILLEQVICIKEKILPGIIRHEENLCKNSSISWIACA